MTGHLATTPGRTIALFDFDGTLTARDTSFAFIAHTVGRARLNWGLTAAVLLAPLDFLAGAVQELAGPPRHRLGSVSGAFEMRFHERVLRLTVRGRPVAELHQRGREWAAGEMQRFLGVDGMERVAWHRERGHACYLVSASIDVYLLDWARDVGFAAVLASRLASAGETVTGRFDGNPCWGREKLRRVRAVLGDLESHELYGYGDSRGDRDLLAASQHRFHFRDGDLIPVERV